MLAGKRAPYVHIMIIPTRREQAAGAAAALLAAAAQAVPAAAGTAAPPDGASPEKLVAAMPPEQLRTFAMRLWERMQRARAAIAAFQAKVAALKRELEECSKGKEEAERAQEALTGQLGMLTEHFSLLQARLASVVDFARQRGVEVPDSVLSS